MSTTDAPTAAARRLTRSRDDRIVGGVCGGVARYLDIDPIIPRVVLAVLAVFGGAGIVLYVLGWLLLPADGAPVTRLERWFEGHRGQRVRDVVIVIAALIMVLFLVNPWPHAHRLGGAAFAVILVLVVAAYFRRRQDAVTTSSAPAAPVYGPMPEPATTAGYPYVAPPPQLRARSWLGWLTLGATLLVAGVFSVVAFAGWAHPQPADVLAACVGVVGLGVLVGALFGRAWAMIPIGLLLVLGLGVANALPRHLTWTAGHRHWTPVGVAAQTDYALGAGDAHLNLTQLAPHQTVSISSRIGAGRLYVTVPPDEVVVIDASASAGKVDILGTEEDGTGVEVRRRIPAVGRHPGTLTLDLQVGFGQVEVRHAAA